MKCFGKGIDKMSVLVTKHAIKRYRERLFDYSSSSERIRQLLREIVAKGRPVCLRPNTHENCYEIKYRGISVVLLKKKDDLIVITCLGDSKYRNWIKQKEANSRVFQSLRYGVN
ncbi:MAG TPA: hypothetical protein VN441_11555 [Syntrophomonas sp.]|jgi:hypothetical protein|nr:hypothetical protein [Syntrophomonas sp.]